MPKLTVFVVLLLITAQFCLGCSKKQWFKKKKITNIQVENLTVNDSQISKCRSDLREKIRDLQWSQQCLEYLHWTLEENKTEKLREFIVKQENKSWINDAIKKDGLTLLHHAFRLRNVEAATLLLSVGASFDTYCTLGNSPLHHAAALIDNQLLDVFNSHNKILEKIINKQNNFGGTPLHVAFRYQNYDFVCLAIEWEARLDIKDKNGISAYDYLLYYANQSLQKSLSKKF